MGCRTELFICLFVLSWELFKSTTEISFIISKLKKKKKGKDWIPLGRWSQCAFPAISGKCHITEQRAGKEQKQNLQWRAGIAQQGNH